MQHSSRQKVAFLLITAALSMWACSGGSGSGNSTGPSPFAGIWFGSTSQGKALKFQVQDDGATGGFIATFKMSFGTDSCTGPLTATSTPSISGSELSVPIAYVGGNIATTMQGAFSDANAINGTYTAFDQSYRAICGSQLIMGTGGAIISAGTWQATRCATGDTSAVCSLVCSYAGDGTCDEPIGGTGMCFLGTDSTDCAGTGGT
jgi:hypothetical protein